MGMIKTGNTKKSFMRDHECRFCLYYGSCSHKECILDGSAGGVTENSGERADAATARCRADSEVSHE